MRAKCFADSTDQCNVIDVSYCPSLQNSVCYFAYMGYNGINILSLQTLGMKTMATLPSVSISNDWQKRLDKEAQYSNISSEDFVVHAVKMAVETQETVRAQQDDETMIGVQQMLNGDYMTIDESRAHMSKHMQDLRNKYST